MKKESDDPIAFLLHYLIQLRTRFYDQLGLRPLDLFILQYISREGKMRDDLPTILRGQLTAVVVQHFGKHDTWLSILLNQLEDKGWVVRISLTSHERQSLFSETSGKGRKALSMTRTGQAVLDHAKAIASDPSWMDVRGLSIPPQTPQSPS